MTALLLWLLAAAGPPADAADWRFVRVSDHDNGRRAWFVDKASLVRTGDKVAFTEMVLFRPDSNKNVMEPTVASVEADCAARTVVLRQHDRTTGEPGPPTTIGAPPRSISADILDSACKAKFGGKVRDVPMAAHLMFQLTPREKRKKAR